MKNLNETIIKELEEDVKYRAEVDFYYCNFDEDEECAHLECHEDFDFAWDAILENNPELEYDEEDKGDYYEKYQSFVASATIDQAEANGYEYNGRDLNNVLWFKKIEEDIEDADDEDDDEDIDE